MSLFNVIVFNLIRLKQKLIKIVPLPPTHGVVQKK